MIPDRVLGLALYLHRTNAARFFVCPECGNTFDKPGQLGVHVERHRDTKAPFGAKKVRKCPKGCGRLFGLAPTSRNPKAMPLDLREHASMCDGSEPLSIPEMAMPNFDPAKILAIASVLYHSSKGSESWHRYQDGWAAYDDASGLLKFSKTPRPPKTVHTRKEEMEFA